MTPEPERNKATAAGAAGSKAASKPRAGVPLWRTGKPDAVLAAAVDVARTAVEGIAPAWQIGQHLGAKTEGDRLVTHLFESKLPGYQGWQWYAVLTRNSRSKIVTVNELGLLPSEESVLAPEWVPWAERVRPEDEQGDEDAVAEPAKQGTADQEADEQATADQEADEHDTDEQEAVTGGATDEEPDGRRASAHEAD